MTAGERQPLTAEQREAWDEFVERKTGTTSLTLARNSLRALLGSHDAAVARAEAAEAALAAIRANAESWHGVESKGTGAQKALGVIARWAADPSSIPACVKCGHGIAMHEGAGTRLICKYPGCFCDDAALAGSSPAAEAETHEQFIAAEYALAAKLEGHEGLWVAVGNHDVIADALTLSELLSLVEGLDPARRDAVEGCFQVVSHGRGAWFMQALTRAGGVSDSSEATT